MKGDYKSMLQGKTVRIALSVLILALAVLAISCAGETGEAVTLKLGHILAPTDPLHLGVEKFAELVDEKTDGAVKVDIYPSSQLGSAPDQIDGVRVGSQDIFVDAISWYQDMEGLYDFRAIAMPTAFDSYDHLLKWLDSSDGQELFKTMESKYGLKVIGYDWYREARQILSKKPVKSSADLKGLEVRVPEQQLWVDAWKAAGCSPSAIAWAEIYTSLQQGLVNAVEAPVSLLCSSKFQEQAKYLTITNHTYNSVGVVMNAEKFNGLTKKQQQALIDAAKEAGQYQGQLYRESESENIEAMVEANVEVFELKTEEREAMFKPTEEFAQQAEASGEWTAGLWAKIKGLK